MSTNQPKTLGERIALIAERLGGEEVLSERTGISLSQIYRYQRGANQPKADAIQKIAEVGSVSVDWLILGRSDQATNESTQERLLLTGDFENKTKVLSEASAKWQINAPPGETHENKAMMHMEGDSMEPTLQDSELVVVDTSFIDPASITEGIYFFELNGQVFARRLQRLPKGRLKVIADNHSYQSFEIDLGDRQTRFVLQGKAIWASGWRKL